MEENNEKSPIEQAGEDLFNFAVDREDIKELLAQMPESAETEITAVEYELPLLKIITVGWSAAYLMENSRHKTALMEVYWNTVRVFSQKISETTGFMTGQDLDYFEIIKQRFDKYLSAMDANADSGGNDPAAVIGPEFARACGNKDDVFAVLIGSKMFVSTLNCVKEYLKAFSII